MSVTRQALYDEVWAEPMLRVAERYGVSSSYMARVCTVMNVPRPPVGYWAKVAVGKSVRKPPLPDARQTDQLDWEPGIALVPISGGQPEKRPSQKRSVRQETEEPRSSAGHRMLAGVKPLLTGAKEVDGYLKPSKRVMVDVLTTKAAMSHVLTTAQRLFEAFEKKQHPVAFAAFHYMRRIEIDEREGTPQGSRYPTPWRPDRPTVAHFDGLAIGLSLIETSEEFEVAYIRGQYVPVEKVLQMRRGAGILASTWKTKQYVPTGLLRLVAYAPYADVEWQMTWRESRSRALVNDAEKIVRELERAVPDIKALIAEAQARREAAQREWELQQQRWKEEQRRRALEEERQRRIKELVTIFSAWENEQRVASFICDMRRRAEAEGSAERVQAKLERAAAVLCETDSFKLFRDWIPPIPAAD